MESKEEDVMKKCCLIVLVTSLVLAAGIITAACVQNGDNSQGQQAGNPASSIQGTEQSNGQRPQMDLASAASNLGVTEQQLSDALSSTRNATSGRTDFTAAAQNLGVTEQQLLDALGIPAGGRIRTGGYNATQTPG